MEGEGEEGSVRYVWPDYETIETETHVSMVETHDSGVPRVELESATVMSTYINLSLTPGIRGVPGTLRRPPRRLCAHTCEPMVPSMPLGCQGRDEILTALKDHEQDLSIPGDERRARTQARRRSAMHRPGRTRVPITTQGIRVEA